jgi:hypothetical protein
VNHVLDARVAAQIRAFDLRFTCDACAHAVPCEGGREACSLGYPNDAHLRTDEVDRALQDPGGNRVHLTFCKEFELQ